MRVDHLCTHFFACGEPEFDVKCKCLHRNVTLNDGKYSLQGTTQSRYLTGGVPPVRFSM